MSETLEVTILGCGSSAGVPRADGAWGACNPDDRRNRRSRCSLLVRRKGLAGRESETTLIVDASPEFRLQAAAADAKRLDALLLTHDHADQCHGIDDIRGFFLRQHSRIPCWMDAATRDTMERRFGYIFTGAVGPYPPIADIFEVPPHGDPWELQGPSGPIPVKTFDQDHGAIRTVGYRFGPVAYSSDVVDLPDESFEALRNLDTWIVDALRYTPHPTHFHVDLALEWIAKVRPRRAILTNMHFDLDFEELASRLPTGVEPAYDGLRFEAELFGVTG